MSGKDEDFELARRQVEAFMAMLSAATGLTVEQIKQLPADIRWIHNHKRRFELVGNVFVVAAITTIVGAALLALWFGVQHLLTASPVR